MLDEMEKGTIHRKQHHPFCPSKRKLQPTKVHEHRLGDAHVGPALWLISTVTDRRLFGLLRYLDLQADFLGFVQNRGLGFCGVRSLDV